MPLTRIAVFTATLALWGGLTTAQDVSNNEDLNVSKAVDLLDRAGDPVVQVSTGWLHACAVVESGQVYCWGDNGKGQLGIGPNASSTVPVLVDLLTDIKEVALGLEHSCALQNSGRVYCWGENFFGQLGNGRIEEDSDVPVRVRNGRNATQISAGGDNTCMVKRNGRAFCWGNGLHGQLGNGFTGLPSSVPARVVGPSNFTQISTSGSHTCGLKTNGRAFCWGSNQAGQLGTGDAVDSNTPMRVPRLQRATRITTGEYSPIEGHSCALRHDGVAFCWGANNKGQLGNGTFVDELTPKRVLRIFDAEEIDAGTRHTCAVRQNGRLVCWGENLKGALGDGTTTDRPMRQRVVRLRGAQDASAGMGFTCAVRDTGGAFCWGANDAGQLGKGSAGPNPNPIRAAVQFPNLP